ncbi:hypothetical protein KBH77_04590 [Patescibacteria group bacterium]|nr:hypothetical protein [Patescibacteria group bacterium]
MFEKFLNKNRKSKENENVRENSHIEEKSHETIEIKKFDIEDIYEVIERNANIIDNILDIDVSPLEYIKEQKDIDGRLLQKIDDFLETIEDIKDYKQNNFNDLILDIKTAKEVLSDNTIDGRCILDLLKNIEIPNNIRKGINKILYFNMQDVDDLAVILNEDIIEKNAKILEVDKNQFEKMIESDPDSVIKKLLYKLSKSNQIELSSLLDEKEEENEDKKYSYKARGNKLTKAILLSAMLMLGTNSFAQQNDKKIENIDYKQTESVDLNEIFLAQPSKEDIERVERTFRDIFKDKKIAENLDKNDIIKNLGWIKAITNIDNDSLRQNIIDGLDKDKQLAYKQFLLFVNARIYFLERDQNKKDYILQYMGELISQIDELKKIEVTSNNISNNTIEEIENNIQNIKNLIIKKINFNAPILSDYDETEVLKYISSAGLKSDRDYVFNLYKQLKEEETKLSNLKKSKIVKK